MWGQLRRTLRVAHLVRAQRVVAVLGLMLTVLGALAAAKAPGIYEAQVYVVFLPPHRSTGNAFVNDRSMVLMAGVIAKAVNGENRVPTPTLDSIPLSSTGVEHGYSVTLPNSGSQWVYQFHTPELDVQATGTSPDEALNRLNQVLDRIQAELAARQSEQGAGTSTLIRTDLSPDNPVLYRATGNKLRAGGSAMLLGLFLTVTLTRLARRLGPVRDRLRRVRRRPDGSSDGDVAPPTSWSPAAGSRASWSADLPGHPAP